MMIPNVFWLVPIASIVALAMAYYFFTQMMKADEGTPRMKEIALYVRKGAMAYLKQQYKVVGIVFAVLCVLFAFMAYGLNVQNPWVPFAFLTGGFFSGLAGFFGMKTATYASARTANAARESLDAGLKIAFRSGAVMGLTVVGLGLLDIAIWFVVLNHFDADGLISITTTMLTFGMGASCQALFARVGGGIYTKAADVGADIVGKVEADIPEDDPRNPATIADNVGDNVGDVAGMGADLYESYCGSVLSTAALGAAAFGVAGLEVQLRAVIAPMLIAAVGVFLSLLGIFLVRTKEGATMRDLLRSLSVGTNVSAVLIAAATFAILYLLGIENWLGLSFSVISGLAAGVIIGQATEYYTSHSYKPTQQISEAGQTGAATVIIKGIGTGMISTCIPVITIGVAIMLSYLCANGFDLSMSSESLAHGLYGIGIAAVGMLSTLGITLATDAYGPIADNAGGNAEMSSLGEEVRHRTDALDALGNTTAATGKGFAIGSAALTALALLASYIEEIKIAMTRANVAMENLQGIWYTDYMENGSFYQVMLKVDGDKSFIFETKDGEPTDYWNGEGEASLVTAEFRSFIHWPELLINKKDGVNLCGIYISRVDEYAFYDVGLHNWYMKVTEEGLREMGIYPEDWNVTWLDDGGAEVVNTYTVTTRPTVPILPTEEEPVRYVWNVTVEGDDGVKGEFRTEVYEDSIYFPSAADVVWEEDVNGDGLMDLVVFRGAVGAHGTMYQDCYLREGKGFVRLEGYPEIPDPYADPETGRIYGTERDAADACAEVIYEIRGHAVELVEEHYYVWDEAAGNYIEKQ